MSYFSADHIRPEPGKISMSQIRRARKPGYNYVPEPMHSGAEYDFEDVGFPRPSPKSVNRILPAVNYLFNERDQHMVTDPFANEEFLDYHLGNKKDKQNFEKRYNILGRGRNQGARGKEENDSEASESSAYDGATTEDSSIDETDMSEDSDDSDEDDSSEVNSDEDDSEDTGEEEDDDEDGDTDDDDDDDDDDSDDVMSDSDDDSDDDDEESDDESDDDEDDDDEDDDDEDDDDEDEDDEDDDDDEDDEDDDDDDDVDEDEDTNEDDTDTDYDDSDDDDDEEDDNDEDSVEDADEEEEPPIKVPYGVPRKGKAKGVRNSSNFTTFQQKADINQSQYARSFAVAQSDTKHSQMKQFNLPFTSIPMFGEAINSTSNSSLKKRVSSATLRDLLNPAILSSSVPSDVTEFKTEAPTSFVSYLESPKNVTWMEKLTNN